MAAGVEPALAFKWKSLMAHGFWFKPNEINNFPASYQSTPVSPNRQQSTPILETIWRRASDRQRGVARHAARTNLTEAREFFFSNPVQFCFGGRGLDSSVVRHSLAFSGLPEAS